ncbi:MAG: hypothetical protein AB7K71_38090 [Polyangiaceae bacterium]
MGDACSSQGECPSGFYCDYATKNCSANLHTSPICTRAPVTCEETTPSCGCDGKVYSSPCAAHQAGVDVGPACDSSLTPTGLIPCGAIYCDPQTTYCLRGDGDAADHIYRCIDLPAACGASPDCDCIDRPHDACEIVSGNGVMGIAVDVDCLLQGC